MEEKKKNDELMLRIEEVASVLGVSLNTVESWYRFKRENPQNKYAKMLPKPTKKNNALRAPRYWKQSDIYKMMKFKDAIPKGRNGIMGHVTQKYVKKKGAQNGKKKTGRH